MRLRVLNALFDDRLGGPQKRVIAVGKKLQDYAVDTVLLVPDEGGDTPRAAATAGLECASLTLQKVPKPREVGRLLIWLAMLPADIHKIVRLIGDREIDLVHVNGAFFLAPAIAAKYVGKSLVWHLNDTVVPPVIAKLLGKLVGQLADQVIVAAEAVARHYGIEGSDYHVVHAPVDVSRIERKTLGRAEGRVRKVGLVANWNPLKGLEVFIQAAAAVSHADMSVEFFIAGARLESHSEYAHKIDQMIEELGLSDKVHSLGFVEDMGEFLAGLDGLVLASWSEASPMAVLEAMAAGVPVVATDVGGIREILVPSEGDAAGMVVTKGDAEGIAREVIRILSDEKLASQLGENGWKRANRLFSLEKCVENHLRVYGKVVEQLIGR